MIVCHPSGKRARRAVAAVEAALLLPFLVFLFLVTVDFCRIFYFSQVVTNSARNGALYACDSVTAAQSPYPNFEEAVLADAPTSMHAGLKKNPPTQEPVNNSKEVRVTVTYPFDTITRYPGIPSSINITRTVQMRVAPVIPN